MAQPGDEITYTYSGAKETEDVSTVDTLIISRMAGAGGSDPEGFSVSGRGGEVQRATVDISSASTLELWIGQGTDRSGGFGRSDGGAADGAAGGGGGSTEILTASGEFIAAADAGGGGGRSGDGGGGGARGGLGGEDAQDAEGSGFGGDGAPPDQEDGNPGGQELGAAQLLDNGSLNKGGGSGNNSNAEVVLRFDKPQAPNSLTATENLDTVGPTVELSWTNPGAERQNNVYRAPGSSATFPDDYTQVATVGPGVESYTDSPSYDSTFSYVVTAELNGVESDTSPVTTITTASEGELVVTLTGTNSPVTTGDTLEFDVVIENIGDYRADENIDAVLEPQ